MDGAVDGRVCDSDSVSQREEEKREPNDQNDREEEEAAETVLDDRTTLRPARRGIRLLAQKGRWLKEIVNMVMDSGVMGLKLSFGRSN